MKRRQRGLTLVELMVTLAVAIVLLAIGIPAFEGIQANSRAAAQANALITALNVARSEAMGRGGPVSVCAKSSEAACGASTAWASGFLVFTDDVGTAGTCDSCGTTTTPRDEVVRSFPALRSGGTLTVTPAQAFVRFNSRGEQTSGARAVFRLQETTGTTTGQDRCVSVGVMGQITVLRVDRSTACP
jgi:type IV fimbrial biogenesis protein FimT